MVNSMQGWPEPVVSVQSLAESRITDIPEKYVKPPSQRPSAERNEVAIPAVDLQHAFSPNKELRERTLDVISKACREFGFFQVVNHGVSHDLMRANRDIWRRFFDQPSDEKQKYANNPATYEGYGSRLGVEKGARLDWSDYFFLHYLPTSLRDPNKWPAVPQSLRDVVEEYGKEVGKLGVTLLKVLSLNLGHEENFLQNAFGGTEDIGICLRTNYYPKCPQPELTLGLSAHTDPGGMTILLADEVAGLQVMAGEDWATVKPVPNSFVVNIGDQIQIISNGIYKSGEHRVFVNRGNERISMALFYNPNGDILISPSERLVSVETPAKYAPQTFNQYRQSIRKKGICDKIL